MRGIQPPDSVPNNLAKGRIAAELDEVTEGAAAELLLLRWNPLDYHYACCTRAWVWIPWGGGGEYSLVI